MRVVLVEGLGEDNPLRMKSVKPYYKRLHYARDKSKRTVYTNEYKYSRTFPSWFRYNNMPSITLCRFSSIGRPILLREAHKPNLTDYDVGLIDEAPQDCDFQFFQLLKSISNGSEVRIIFLGSHAKKVQSSSYKIRDV